MNSKKTEHLKPSQEKNIPPPPQGHRGSNIWSTKFSEEDIKVIRKMHAAGWGIKALAERYETTWSTMSRIVKGVSWKHVTDD